MSIAVRAGRWGLFCHRAALCLYITFPAPGSRLLGGVWVSGDRGRGSTSLCETQDKDLPQGQKCGDGKGLGQVSVRPRTNTSLKVRKWALDSSPAGEPVHLHFLNCKTVASGEQGVRISLAGLTQHHHQEAFWNAEYHWVESYQRDCRYDCLFFSWEAVSRLSYLWDKQTTKKNHLFRWSR